MTLEASAAIGAAAFVVSLALTAAMMRGRFVVDMPNARSSHRQPTPRAGGIGIVIGVIVAALIASIASPTWLLLACATIVALAGLADDIRARSFRVKLTVQIGAALACLAAGFSIEAIVLPGIGPVALGWAGLVLALAWMVGLTNAVNFMDGLDGLAGASCAISGAFLALIAWSTGAGDVVVLALAIAAACLGFLVFNRPPARIFMGDVGSQFLGFLLAGLALMLALGDRTSLIAVAPLLFFHFIFDTALTLARRWRAGERLTAAHRSHLYQRLQQTGLSHGAVTTILAAMTALQGLLALWLVGDPPNRLGWTLAAALAVQMAYAGWVTRREKLGGG